MKSLQNICASFILLLLFSCNSSGGSTESTAAAPDSTAQVSGGQEKVQDNDSEKDVVKVAVSSKDHTTLVAALKQADLVTALSNAGPFTVFAPTNEAFAKLPAGTMSDLMKDAKKEDLRNVLQYHVTLGVLKPESLKDGQVLGMVNGDNVTVQVKDGKISLNNSVHVITSINASNGIIYVVDGVLLPPAGK
jgi:uncharacterized surface protein with fasciclin (FAS1) repeats